MGPFTPFLRLACLAAALTPTAFAVTLDGVQLSKTSTDNDCNPGQPTTSFLSTDARAYYQVDVSNALAGEVLRVEWIRPDGVQFSQSSHQPLPAPGAYCLFGNVTIAGTAAVNFPGTWTFRGFWNNTQLFTRTFTLTAPGGTGGGGTSLLVNGSFEQPGGPAGSFLNLPTGSTHITGWQVSFGDIDYIGSGYWAASDGGSSLDLGGFTPGAIAQTFNTQVGTTYTVTFDMAGNTTGIAQKTLQVTVAGQTQNFTFDTTGRSPTNMGWSQRSFTFTATSTTSRIEFRSTTPGPYGPTLDNVRVTGGTGGGGGSCTYALDLGQWAAPGGGGTQPLAITTTSGCTWSATASASWLSVSPSSGSGSATVIVTAQANTSGQFRTGTITVQGRVLTVSQPAGQGCNFTVGPLSWTAPQAGGTQSVSISTATGCTWSASTSSAFLTLSTQGGTGNGSVLVTALPNTTGQQRTGTVTIAGQTFTVTQPGLGCTYTLTPTSWSVSSSGGTQSVTITTGSGCQWSVVITNLPWLSASPSSGTGSGSTTLTAQANTGTTSRTANITIAAQTFGVSQGTGSLTVSPGQPFTVDGKSNIYASGQATAFSGLLPPTFRFSAGPNQILRVSASGTVGCVGGASNPPDGSIGGGCGSTNLTALNGLSGIQHRSRAMFLVGVFLTDGPAPNPAPPAMDVTNDAGFTRVNPRIGQVFFVGDGSGTGGAQSFHIPPTATRAFFGFADGFSFQGEPGYYDDNQGALQVTASLASGAPCNYSFDPASPSVSGNGELFRINVATDAGCFWSPSPQADWLPLDTAYSQAGSGLFQLRVARNPANSERSANIAIADRDLIVRQRAPVSCSFAINPLTITAPATGANGTFSITATDSSCTWTATPSSGFITVSPTSGTGNLPSGSYTIAPNTTSATRTGSITISGPGASSQTISVSQQGAVTCSYQLLNNANDVPWVSGLGTANVITTEGCGWSVSKDAPWIAIESGLVGSNKWPLLYSFAANTGAARTGTITITPTTGPPLIHTVRQEAARDLTAVPLDNGDLRLPGSTLRGLAGGSTTIPGWTVSRSSVDYIATCIQPVYCIDLNGGAYGAISRTLNTVPGGRYTVVYDVGANGGGLPDIKTLEVRAAGLTQRQTIDTAALFRSTSEMLANFNTRAFDFTATAATTTLEFVSLDNQGLNFGPVIANVRLFAGTLPGGGGGSGTNLIRNPGADAGPSTGGCGGSASIPDWTTDGNVSVCAYGTSGGFPPASVGPPNGAPNFFAGGSGPSARMSQVLTIAAGSEAKIDSGTSPFRLSAWLGGFTSDPAEASLRITFRNTTGATLGTQQVGPVTPADRALDTKLLLRERSGMVPGGTRTILVEAIFNQLGSGYNDAYADNLSLEMEGVDATSSPAGTGGTGGTGGTSCTTSITPATRTMGSPAGEDEITVSAPSNCNWTATTTDTWLRIVNGTGTGDGRVRYAWIEHTGAADRTGRITLGSGRELALTQLPPAPAVTNFVNGDFEQPGITGAFETLFPGSTRIPGWAITSGSVDYIGTFFQHSQGRGSIDLAGTGNGSITQTFPTVPGTRYIVVYDFAGNAGTQTVKTMEVSAGGPADTQTFDTFGRTVTRMEWVTRTFVFTATAASTQLKFAAVAIDSAFGPALDNVRVYGQTAAGGGTTGNFGANQIRNPGADAGPATGGCGSTASIPEWTTDGRVSVCSYSTGGGFPVAADGPPDGPPNFFAGGFGESALLSQVLNLAPGSEARIDTGTSPYRLSAWLGGFSSDPAAATLRITFRNASGANIGTQSVGPVTPSDRALVTKLLLREASGNVPRDTRSILVEVIFTQNGSGYNDAYADNLSLQLEPGITTTPGSTGTGGTGGTSCITSMTPTARTIGSPAGEDEITISAPSSCNWTATTTDTWLRIVNGTGTGDGRVRYAWIAHTGAADRTGRITLGTGRELSLTQLAPAPLVTNFVNGDFEQPGITGAFETLPTGSTRLPGWSVTSGTVDYVGTFFQPSQGTGSVDLAGTGNGSITQTFPTVPGTRYIVVYDFAGNAGTQTVKTMEVSAGGSPDTQTFDATGRTVTRMEWVTRTFVFTATSASTQLKFAAVAIDSAFGPALDNVRVYGQTAAGGSTGGTSCITSITPTTRTMGSPAGEDELAVTAPSTCNWTATTTDTWLRIVRGTGTGNGLVRYGWIANTSGADRTGRITLGGGRDLTLTQLAAAPAVTNFQNGSFEQPAISGFEKLVLNSTRVPGWTVTAGEVDIVGTGYWRASDGINTIDLIGEISGAIAQTFPTVPGTRYVVVFDLSSNSSANAPRSMSVSAAGATESHTFDGTGHTSDNMMWVTKTLVFTANSASTRIEFRAAPDPTAYGPAIDNVRVYGQTAAGGGGGTTGPATPAVLGSNSVRNPGAEEQPVSIDTVNACRNTPSIPGWTIEQGAAVCSYTFGQGFPGPSNGPPNPGSNFFAGGGTATTTTSKLSQTIDTTAIAVRVDSGTLPYQLSAWLGGYASDSDNVAVKITFRNSAGAPLSTAQVGPVTPADRQFATKLIQRATSGTVPAGTRSILVEQIFTSGSGYIDGYSDNISLILDTPTGGSGGAGSGTTCTYTLGQTSQTMIAAGGTNAVSITTQAGCAWNVNSVAGFLTVNPTNGTGTSTINYTVAQNTGGERTGTFSVTGPTDTQRQTFTVTQFAASAPPVCTPSLDSLTSPATKEGGPGQVRLTLPGGCPWTVTTSGGFITLTAAASGNGSSTITFNIAANTGAERRGTLTIAGLTHTVIQASGSRTAIPPCAFTFAPPAPAFPASGGSNIIDVTTSAGCQWNPLPSDSWIRITGGFSQTGSSRVSYTVDANGTGALRTGSISIGGQPYVINQDGGTTAPTCTYALSRYSVTAKAAGGIDNVDILAPAGCAWTATGGSFVNITEGTSGTGGRTVTFLIQPNTAATSRTTTLTIAQQTFNVTQEGTATGIPCTFTLAPSSASAASEGGPGSFFVQTATGCAWTASRDVDWVDITSGGSGNGPGTLNYSVAANATGAPRNATITVQGVAFPILQQASSQSCTFNFAPNSPVTSEAGGGSSNLAVFTSSGCSWSATKDVDWITILSGASGSGTGTVAYSVLPNTGGERTGNLTIGGRIYTVLQRAASSQPSCTITLSPSSQTFQSGASAGQVAVITTTGCSWTATANADWLGVTAGSAGSAAGTVTYSVAANSGAPRTGTITIGGQAFTVSQDGNATAPTAGNCTFSLTPLSQQVIASGGTGQVEVATTGGCQWTAIGPDWITITSGAQGNGSGTVFYSIASNAGDARTGSIQIGGQSVTVSQDSGGLGGQLGSRPVCNYTLTPATDTAAGSGGPGQVNVATQVGCSWKPTTDVDWISITEGGAGSGTGVLRYTVAPNAGGTRSGSISIGGRTFTVTQSEAGTGGASGTGCTLQIAPASQQVQGSQTAGQVVVSAASGCAWTATTNAEWLSILNGASGNGAGTVTYSVTANPGGERTGTLTIAGQTFTVTQAASGTGGASGAGCSFTVNPSTLSVAGEGGAAQFVVGTPLGCTWNATSSENWVSFASGASGNGAGTVTINVAPNGSGTRVATLTAGNASLTVTQSGGSGCRFVVSPATLTAGPAGGLLSIRIDASDNACAWTASSNDAWLTPQSNGGAGSGLVDISVSSNGTLNERTGSLSVAGQLVTVRQSGVSFASRPGSGGPRIASVANAASLVAPIARGSYFTINGAGLAPDGFISTLQNYPIPFVINDVSVSITQGSITMNALVHSVTSTQINAVMPSKTPLGEVELRVTYRGVTGPPTVVNIVEASWGSFHTNGAAVIQNITASSQPMNTPESPAMPSQNVILWGTGLGAILGDDAMPPPLGQLPSRVEVLVGGVPAQLLYNGRAACCAAVDNLIFTVPAGAPMGCKVPVTVRVNDIEANSVTMSISSDGQRCSQ